MDRSGFAVYTIVDEPKRTDLRRKVHLASPQKRAQCKGICISFEEAVVVFDDPFAVEEYDANNSAEEDRYNMSLLQNSVSFARGYAVSRPMGYETCIF